MFKIGQTMVNPNPKQNKGNFPFAVERGTVNLAPQNVWCANVFWAENVDGKCFAIEIL